MYTKELLLLRSIREEEGRALGSERKIEEGRRRKGVRGKVVLKGYLEEVENHGIFE